MARRKLTKPTKAMRDKAIRQLDQIVSADNSPIYARVSAAKELLRGDRAEADAESAKRPPGCMFLPDSGRNPTSLGIYDLDHQTVVIYDGRTEQGMADCARWREEMAARIALDYPPDAPDLLALPAPEKPKPMTAAERQKRARERKRAAKAAA